MSNAFDDVRAAVERADHNKGLPILFQGPLVRGIQADTKTQTRRIAKEFAGRDDLDAILKRFPHQQGCPYGQPGDRLWVKETFYAFGRWETRYSPKKGRDEWHFVDMTIECGHWYFYDATSQPERTGHFRRESMTPQWWKRPAIFMPRAASRVDLEITEVRVERLQAISEADARAEGVTPTADPAVFGVEGKHLGLNARESYSYLWEAINGPGSVDANPWVWAVSFRRVQP